MEQTQSTSPTLIELRLTELIQLITPLHALLEGSYDETAGRLGDVIEALAQIAYELQKTVKALNVEKGKLSPALEAKLNILTTKQEVQMQMLAELHEWLGAPQRQIPAQDS
ncbi:hypothetical protein OS189_17070 [Sulfitobacter sp. F26169L]|uniref:hypothetical protein n=1 Tax=Sulfitobacter sp. F26169L TaxID=2996015 RepID=UPI00226086C4|nr:hypothetical protein [Sulfitobacter sp. F26169L]MCX7568056.1 hypothetical protein [Sulfitobacter sp. F26169L]